jgi:hypothetical protein
VWAGDKHFLPLTSTRSNPPEASVGGFDAPSLFAVERFSSVRASEVPFYSIPAPAGLYQAHLLFVELRAVGPGDRVFSASVNNASEPSIDAAARVGLRSLLRVVLSNVFVGDDNTLNITLFPIRGNAKINALEVYRQTAPLDAESEAPLFSLRIACGQFASVFDETNNVVWNSDRFFVESNTQARAFRFARSVALSSLDSTGKPIDPSLFSRERFGVSTASSPVFYRFPVPVGKYAINLYFVERTRTEPGERLFDIVLSNQTLAQSIDTATQAPAGTVFPLHFPEVFLLSGVFELSLVRLLGNPKISALSVQQVPALSVPPTPPQSAPLSLRINCGSSQAYVDSAGREWIADRFFSESTQNALLRPPRVANISRDLWPLFETARVSLPDGFADSTFYRLDVAEGLYELTLFFCERMAVAVGERVFDVLLNDDMMVADMDIMHLAGQNTAFWITLRGIAVRRDEPLRLGLQRRRGSAILSALALDPVSAQPLPPALPLPPPGVIRIDCGSLVAHMDAFGHVWMEDTLFAENGLRLQQAISPAALSNDPFGAPLLYATVRALDTEDSDCCSPKTLYHLPASEGRYTLTLFFTDALSRHPRERIFDVLINNRIAVGAIDIYATVGPSAVLSLPVVGVQPEGGFISLALRAVTGVPIVGALELAPLLP